MRNLLPFHGRRRWSEAGSPVLIRVEAADAASVDGEWLGRKVDFFRGADGQAWFALAGVDVEGATGPSTLWISVRLSGGGVRRPESYSPDSSRTLPHWLAHCCTKVVEAWP